MEGRTKDDPTKDLTARVLHLIAEAHEEGLMTGISQSYEDLLRVIDKLNARIAELEAECSIGQ